MPLVPPWDALLASLLMLLLLHCSSVSCRSFFIDAEGATLGLFTQNQGVKNNVARFHDNITMARTASGIDLRRNLLRTLHLQVSFTFTGIESPSYIPHNGTSIIIDLDVAGTLHNMTVGPDSMTFSNAYNSTAATWVDLLPFFNSTNVTNPNELTVAEFFEIFENTKIHVRANRAADGVSTASFILLTNTWLKEDNKFFVQMGGSRNYEGCKTTCQQRERPTGTKLATPRSEQDHKELIRALSTSGQTDCWTGIRNWGQTNGSAGDLLCHDSDPTFTLAGCRATDDTAMWSGNTATVAGGAAGCLQPYCGYIQIDENPVTRTTGRTAFRLKVSSASVDNHMFADLNVDVTRVCCLCERILKSFDGEPLSPTGLVYLYASNISQLLTVPTATQSLVAPPTGTASKTQSVNLRKVTPTPSSPRTPSRPDLTSSASLEVSATVPIESGTETMSISATPSAGSRSKSLTLTDSKSSSALVSASTTISMTPSSTLVRPTITLIQPTDSQTLSEKAIYLGRDADTKRTIRLMVAGADAVWNCEAVRSQRLSLFSAAPGTNASSVPSGFMARLSVLLPVSGLHCEGAVLAFTLPRDRSFSIDSDERIVLKLRGDNGMVVDSPRIDLTGLAFERTITVSDDRTVVTTVPKAVVATAEATATTSTAVAAAAGNPAVAVAASRTALILSLVICEDTTEDGLDWMSHPLGLEVGLGITGVWAGAAVWNPLFVISIGFIHFIAGWTVAAYRGRPIRHGLSKLYFPAIEAMLILPLLQPTAAAATTVLRQSSDFLQVVSAGFGGLMCLLFLSFVGRITLFKGFGAKFEPYPTEGDGKRNCLRVFLTGPGDYVGADGTDHFIRMYFLYFDIYRRERVWFVVAEMGMTILFGVLEGWRPTSDQGCKVLVILMAALFLLFFILVVVLRPFVSRFELGMGFLIVGIQTIGAVSTAVYSLTTTTPAINIGGWSAMLGLYILSGKAVIDLVITIYDFLADCLCASPSSTPSKSTADGMDDAGGGLEEGLLTTSALVSQEEMRAIRAAARKGGRPPPPPPPPPPLPPALPKYHQANPLAAGRLHPNIGIPPPPPGPPPAHILKKKGPPPIPRLATIEGPPKPNPLSSVVL